MDEPRCCYHTVLVPVKVEAQMLLYWGEQLRGGAVLGAHCGGCPTLFIMVAILFFFLKLIVVVLVEISQL